MVKAVIIILLMDLRNIHLESIHILDAMENTCESWEEIRIATGIGGWKKLTSTLMEVFESFKTLIKEIAADVVEVETEPEDGNRMYYNFLIELG